MRQKKVLVIGVIALIALSGCAETGTQLDTETWKTQTSTKSVQQTTVSTVETTQTADPSLLTQDELYPKVVDDDPDQYNESLFYVSENGTWYHAYVNGTISSEKPFGDDVPFYSDKTITVPAEQRPGFVWKVTRTESCPALTIYDAITGQELVKDAQTQCPPIPTNKTLN